MEDSRSFGPEKHGIPENGEWHKMCDLENITLLWFELLPYVDVTKNGNGIVNQTGVIYDFFKQSLADCCHDKRALDYDFKHDRKANQQDVLSRIRREPGGVGMPISLDSEFPHLPTEFVPIFQTDGLFWVKVKDPEEANAALGSISATGLPLLLVVVTLTGYAALILWLLEFKQKRNRQFSRSFLRGLFECYWCAFISATTVGYGDKVAQSVAGKIFTMFWILSGICIISTFTGMVATIMNSLMAQDDSTDKPFYNQNIGVLEGSLDYLVLIKKSANTILCQTTEELTHKLNNRSVFNIVMDKHAYWVYRARIHQNQSFEFRPGVQNPTTIGYMYNTHNDSLLRCLKDYSVFKQVEVTMQLENIVVEAYNQQQQNSTQQLSVALFFGQNTYVYLSGAVVLLFIICAFGALVDFAIQRANKREDDAGDHFDKKGDCNHARENGNVSECEVEKMLCSSKV